MRIQAEANLSALMESTEDLIWAVDSRLRLITFNSAFNENCERNYGGPAAPGMSIRELLPPELTVYWLPLYERALLGKTFSTEHTLADGRTLELSFSPIVADGETTGVSVFGKDITERMNAESALRTAEADLSALIESTRDLIWSVDLDYRMTTYNGALRQNIRETFGVELKSGMRHYELLPPERAALWPEFYARAISEGPFRVEYPLILPRIIEMAFSPIIVDGEIIGVSVFGKDITERKQAEQALLESEAHFRKFFEENGSAMILIEPESGEVVSANKAAAAYFGVSPEEAAGISLSQVILTPLDEWAANWQRVMRRERSVFSYRIRLASGEEREVEAYSSPFEVNGRVLMFSIVHDITERKRAEVALREREESLLESQKIAGLGSYQMDIRTGLWQGTEVLQSIFGIDKSYRCDVDGWAALIHPEDRERMIAYFAEEVVGKGQSFDKEYRIIRQSDGAERWVHGLGRLEFDDQGRAIRMRGTIQDTTERRQAEMLLGDSEERYRATFEQAAVGIVHASFEGRILRSNARFAGMLGYTAEELSGMTIRQVTAPEDCKASIAAIKRTRRDDSTSEILEKRYLRKDGSLSWAKLTISLQRDGEGRPLHLVAIAEDINARKAAEQSLANAQEALRLSEERYHTVFETSSDAVLIARLSDGVIIDANQALIDAGQYERNEVIGHTTQELGIWVNESDRQRLLGLIVQNGGCRNLEVSFKRKDGKTIWMRLSASLIEVRGCKCTLTFAQDISAAKEANELLTAAAEALRLSEERYRTVFETSPDAVNISRLSDGMIIDVNQSFLDSTGFTRNEVIGRTTKDLGIWVNDSDRQRYFDSFTQNPRCRDLEVLSRRKNGEIFWMRLSAALIEIDGIPYRLVFAKEITEVKEAAEALRQSEERYRTAFQTSIDAININRLDDGNYIDCNQAFLDVLGYEREEVIGKTALQLGVWADIHDQMTMVNLVRQNGSCRGLEGQFRKKSGELFWGVMSASAMDVDGVPCVLSITRDLSEVKAAQNEIRSLAYYDPLTGLPNRRLLLERLRQSLAAGGRQGRLRALLFVELDNFKMLNETIGHLTGDLLLMEVARRIVTCAREADIVSRFGGDEFALMLEDLSETAEEAAAQAKTVAEKIQETIAQPFVLEGRECITTASIGITVFGSDREGTSELIHEADIAIYQATSAGRNTIRFFSPALQTAVNARATLEEDLRQAIKTGQFLLYYQPQVARGRLVGAEALIRWQHPKRGLVWPGEFIPLAEETGLILPLGDWVLETACTQLAVWARRKQSAHLMLAVNISALQFRQPGFVATVLSALERTGANPKKLKLELTESMLVDNIEEVIAKMSELKAHGLSFALDDFGTGYSSLAYLKRLPLDQLKIDRAFVRDMLVDVASGAIAQTIISLGRAMGLSVMAEGVENEEQRGFLAGLGCHTFQGFLFNPPLTLEQFEALLLM